MMTLGEMIDVVIRKRGFEDFATIKFCRICEAYQKHETTLDKVLEFYMIAMR
jgi:hypothetical protein